MPFQLGKYLGRFDEVMRQKFKRTYDYSLLEEHFRKHATGKNRLTAQDVQKIFSAENSAFAEYWPKPQRQALEENLRQRRIYLGPLKDGGKTLVNSLLPVFHDIGTVSLVLRFTHPQRFGIFSTPVNHLLLVSRPATVDLYLAYCDVLERWREHFRLASVAQTEMALWTYAEFIKLSESGPEAEKARQQFEEDFWVQRERAAQVIRPFFRRYGPLQLAQVLLDEDHIVAGKIAGEEYERLLGVASVRFLGREMRDEKGAAEKLIMELETQGHIYPQDKVELDQVWQTRNQVVHPRGKRAERVEVEVMIDRIQRICAPWDSVSTRAKTIAAKS